MIKVNEHYIREVECIYKGEHYSVRDNGAVMRHHRMNKRKRKDDDVWTFGNASEKTGYMELSGERIHRIVATAFHGEPPTTEHVVDHIDTNRRNNRPENLRWVTRLENILLNPVTCARISFICGSIEKFLENPSLLKDYEYVDKNFSWMRAVSPDEATRSLQRLKAWARNPISSRDGSLGEWIFNEQSSVKPSQISHNSHFPKQMMPESTPTLNIESNKDNNIYYGKDSNYGNSETRSYNEDGNIIDALSRNTAYSSSSNGQMKNYLKDKTGISNKVNVIKSLTSNAVQIDWKIPSEFPCCPPDIGINPLADYASKLKAGEVFCQNNLYKSFISDFALANEGKDLLVITKSDNAKPWSLALVTYKDGVFYHHSRGSFFEENGVRKQFTLAQGKEWTGGDSIDDYC